LQQRCSELEVTVVALERQIKLEH